MLLPTRLEQTTLGDLLGGLYRERLSGVLELIDDRGTVHKIGLDLGHVCAVDTALGPRLGELLERRHGAAMAAKVERQLWCGGNGRLGERLVAQGSIAQSEVTTAVHEQSRLRLDALFELSSARVVFRPARSDRERMPLRASDYLAGRARRRGAATATEFATSAAPNSDAWAVLGLEPGAGQAELRAAYRRRALELHPDSNLHREPSERARTTAQFVRLSAAYRTLVA